MEHNVYDENGEIVCTKRVYNDRLLMFLLRHLKPELCGGAGASALLPHPREPAEPAEPPRPPKSAARAEAEARTARDALGAEAETGSSAGKAN